MVLFCRFAPSKAFWLVAFDLCFLEDVFAFGELVCCTVYDNCAINGGFDFVANFAVIMIPF